MTANTTLNEYMTLNLKNLEDDSTIKNAINTIQKEFLNYYPKMPKIQEEDITVDYNKILNSIVLSVKKFAYSAYKDETYLESKDIDQIKSSLNNYMNHNDKIKEFKKELTNDLNEFQNQIRFNYNKKLMELEKQRRFYEKQIRVFEFEKNKLIMDRLAKIVWPYDEKTKEYENKIAKLQAQLQQCIHKIGRLEQAQPSANEKDILIYQMHLREKYSKKYLNN